MSGKSFDQKKDREENCIRCKNNMADDFLGDREKKKENF